MNISKEHIERAERIDTFVNTILNNGGSEGQILMNMEPYMHDFKFLMDNLPKGGMDVLCSRYDGFYRFAKLLEKMAERLSSGKIKV